MTEAQIEAAEAAVRKFVNDAGYGSYISEAVCRELAIAVLKAIHA
jgi:hypothetical protein